MTKRFFICFVIIYIISIANLSYAVDDDSIKTSTTTASDDSADDEDDDEEDIQEKLAIKNKNNITNFFKPKVITGSAGPVWQANGQTQTVLTEPNVIKTYKANNNTSTVGGVSIFAGFQKTLNSKFKLQLGAALENVSNGELSGDIWDDGDPEFNNFTYAYTIKATRIVAKGKLLYEKIYTLQPWVSASIGVSYNKAYNFLNDPKIFPAIRNFNFKSYTTQAFTYGFGLGLQRNLSKKLQIGAGYQFVDWGNSRLSKAPRQQNFNVIKMDHYYTNGLLFNLTYIAED